MNIETSIRTAGNSVTRPAPKKPSARAEETTHSDSFEPSSTAKTLMAATGALTLGGAGYFLGSMTGDPGSIVGAVGGGLIANALAGGALLYSPATNSETPVYKIVAGAAVLGSAAGGFFGSGDISVPCMIAGGLAGLLGGIAAHEVYSKHY